MTQLSKRDVLMALTALGAGAAGVAQAQTPTIDLSAGRAIGEAYLASRPHGDRGGMRQALLPDGFNEAALARLRTRVSTDFRAGRIFVHQGWRLSDTEAQLFALLAA